MPMGSGEFRLGRRGDAGGVSARWPVRPMRLLRKMRRIRKKMPMPRATTPTGFTVSLWRKYGEGVRRTD